ncbi:MAG: pentapeptide repeat-containing protein, partial [Spirochaetales bacterium]|nr:pentapeptide repeat-containing protein [Spirochaetales bacterium]
MFTLRTCSAANCGNRALHNRDVCRSHLDDPAVYDREISELLYATGSLAELNLCSIVLRDLDLSGKSIDRCILSHADLHGVDFSGSRIQLVFLDFSLLDGCSFRSAKLQTVVFAGSRIENCDFTESDIVHCNFCGVRCRDTLFNGSDLYASRFIASSLSKVGFKDCNLK